MLKQNRYVGTNTAVLFVRTSEQALNSTPFFSPMFADDADVRPVKALSDVGLPFVFTRERGYKGGQLEGSGGAM